MPRVAAIGLDAGDWGIVEALLERDDLPNLARIRRQGAACALRNPDLFASLIVWEAFLTGKEDLADPRIGGVGFDPANYETYKIGAGRDPTFWAGLDTIAFDVPHLSLDDGDRGVRICTWGTHSRSHPRASQPPDLLAEIDVTFGTHPAFEFEHEYGWHRPDFVDRLAAALTIGCRRRADIGRWLRERFPDWQLFLAVLSESHSAGENFGHVLDPGHPLGRTDLAEHHRDALRRVYRALDDAIGRLTEGLPPDTVTVVFSIHGTAANEGELASTVLLPELLHRLSFGHALLGHSDPNGWQERGCPPVVPASSRTWEAHIRAGFGDGHRGRLRRVARHARRAVERRLGSARGGDSLDWQVPCWYRSWWPRMQVFVLPTFGDARLRVNLRERERHGIVDPEDYERACDDVERCVEACRNPRTGGPVVGDIVRTRVADPMDPNGPDADIVIRWIGALDALEHPAVGIVGPFPFRRTGAHSEEGFALFAGPGIEPAGLGTRRAIDLPPTLLALLDRQPPEGLHGRPIPVVRQKG